jgi:hypothetical protein
MTRKAVSSNELQKQLNSRLHKLIGSQIISFGETINLVELDIDGCNWSKSIFMKGNQSDISFYKLEIQSTLNKVSEEFNLLDK